MENQMLCYQCGCTKQGKCCNDTVGACGKSAETSRLQDELTGALAGLAKASAHKSIDEDIQRLMVEGLAATAAHTDFDNAQIIALTEQAQAAKTKYIPKFGSHNASLKLPDDFDIRVIWQKSPDIRSLKSLLLFGIRGIALYANESMALGNKNKEAAGFFLKALMALGANHFKEDYYDLLKEMGGIALRAMEQANKARTTAYGEPSPVDVPRVIDPGPFIIVSGHHFEILKEILEQTNGTGVNVYSHGEMLSAHAYPEFRKYPHFKGHYGTGWQNQQQEFDRIPAAVIFTSGCVTLPLASYADRIFTTGNAHIGGISHLTGDFTPAIIRCIELGGAPEQIVFPGLNGGNSVKTGFGRKTIRTISYKLAAALAEGGLHHIYVVGGCDGTEEKRGEYTNLIRRIPDDAVVFTWGCAKYRFNDINYGEIDGIPRIIDLGMCGDLPIVIATIEALAESAKMRVEELPLTWHYSWQEQRSAAQLFALLATDTPNIILGPGLPPYFTTEVFRTVAKETNMTLFTDSETDKTVTEIPTEPEKEEISTEMPLVTETAPPAEEERPYSPAELEERSAAAGLPDWAMMDEDEDDEDEEETAAAVAESVSEEPKIRPEDLDQSPVWLTADESETDESTAVSQESEMDIEARSAAAGLPAWAMEEDEDDTTETEPSDTAAVPVKTDVSINAADSVKNYTLCEDAPKIVLPKGKGVSGWKDPDEEPSFTPGDRKPYHYTPPKELVEIAPPPPVILPAGAGVSGFAANHDYDTSEKEETVSTLYSFAEPQPEIKIPKGKGVSGWKGEDEDPRLPRRGGDSEKAAEKPWLKKSLEKLRAEVELENKPAAPIPSAMEQKEATTPAADPTPMPAEEATVTKTETAAPAESSENSDKPWLAASLKQLKESIAADAEEAADKNSNKPWLQNSLNALHAEVEAEKNGGETAETPSAQTPAETASNDEEAYVSAYRHDPDTAAAKPWLKTSIEELKTSIDRDAGIKSVRSEKKAPAKEKTAEEAAARWQNAAAPKSWRDIAPATEEPQTTPTALPASAPTDAAPVDATKTEHTDEPTGGGEPPELWQKPPVTEKPWDKNLQTTWRKPEVLPKPWEMPQPTEFHTSNLPLGNTDQQQNNVQQQSYAEQQAFAQQQAFAEQQALAQQQAFAEQQALAQQQAFAQQQALAQQQAFAEQQALAQQQAFAEQQALARQQALTEQQAFAQQQQAQWLAQQEAREAEVQQQRQAAYEAEQRAFMAQRNIDEQTAQIQAAQAAQETYAAQLREQAYRMEEARAQQEAQAAQLAQQAAQIRQMQQQQQQQMNRQSMRSRQEQAAYAAQLEQQAEQLRVAQAQQAAYRAQLDQQQAQMQAAQRAQAQQAAQLAQQEQMLYQAAQQQQQAAQNPYLFGNGGLPEEPMEFAPDAGVSGFRQTTFVPGQERAAVNIGDAIRGLPNVPQNNPANILPGTGVSGSRYHEELPPLTADYSACYSVPQTPRVNLPRGAGISGWNDPNPPMNTAPIQNNNFFGFMDSDAPAGARSNTEIITPGSGDEFIATKGPDGEVTVTIRADKNK